MMRLRAAIVIASIGLVLPAASARAAEAAKSKGEDAVYRYDSKGQRDPFVSLVRDGRLVAATGSPLVQESKPVLYGILWDPSGHSIALINDTEVRVGDKIGEYRVKEIQRNAVVLDLGGEPVVLEIAFDTPPGPRSKTP